MDLTVNAGEIVCLSGPSGSGKSLLLRSIADLIPHHGDVMLDDVSCMSLRADHWRQRVGLLMAESQWWSDRVGDHFSLLKINGFEQLGFNEDVMNWQVSRCSTGEKQRLALLRLLANQPQALLLDEPTASLDHASVGKVEALIDSYRQQHAAPVIWVSHDPRQIKRVCDRQLVIEDGAIHEVAQ